MAFWVSSRSFMVAPCGRKVTGGGPSRRLLLHYAVLNHISAPLHALPSKFEPCRSGCRFDKLGKSSGLSGMLGPSSDQTNLRNPYCKLWLEIAAFLNVGIAQRKHETWRMF